MLYYNMIRKIRTLRRLLGEDRAETLAGWRRDFTSVHMLEERFSASISMTRRDIIVCVVVFVLCTAVYLANRQKTDVGDVVPSRHLPVSVLTQGNLDLDEFPYLYRDGTPYFLLRRNSHYYSAYPVGTPLLALPIYALAQPFTGPFNEMNVRCVEKLAATVLAALSVAALFLVLRLLAPFGNALAIALLYAFATSTWSTSSQGLWQHPGGQLMNCLAMLFLVLASRITHLNDLNKVKHLNKNLLICLSGFCAAYAVVCRPTNLVTAVLFAGYVLLHHRRQVALFLLGALPAAAFLAWYNMGVVGVTIGGYSMYGSIAVRMLASGKWIESVAGILVSPSRGLFVYTPVTLVAVLGGVLALKRRAFDLVTLSAFVPVVYLGLFATWENWWGGFSFGPRLYADALPFMGIAMLPAFERFSAKSWFKTVVAGLAVLSVAMQAIGAFFDDPTWNMYPHIDRSTWRLWDARNAQIPYILAGGRLPTWRWPGEPLPAAEDVLDFTDPASERFFEMGWTQCYSPWAWMLGLESRMGFRAICGRPSTLTLSVATIDPPVAGMAQQVTVLVDGEAMGTFTLMKPWALEELTVRVPPGKDDAVELVLKSSYARKVARNGFGDPRTLSLGIASVRLKR